MERAKNYCIAFQCRASYNGRFGTRDWRAYRRFMVWPILFATLKEANEFMRENGTFKNLNGRKLSMSVYDRRTLRKMHQGDNLKS